MIEQAKLFAIAAHEAVGQRRRYTNEPYYVHTQEVATLVQIFRGTDAMIAAAHLHDVVEDTKIPLDVIQDLFGDRVGDLVHWLTDKSKLEDGNRKVRKAIDRNHLAQAPAEAQLIKCCDIISNTRTIVMHDPIFAVTYLEEINLLLDVLVKANPIVLLTARRSVASAEKLLTTKEIHSAESFQEKSFH